MFMIVRWTHTHHIISYTIFTDDINGRKEHCIDVSIYIDVSMTMVMSFYSVVSIYTLSVNDNGYGCVNLQSCVIL